MPKKKSNHKKKKSNVFLLSVTALFLLIGITYYFSSLLIQIYGKYKEKVDLEKKLVKMETDTEKLNKDLEKLQDPEYIAKYAREKFYYSKDGEIIIKSK